MPNDSVNEGTDLEQKNKDEAVEDTIFSDAFDTAIKADENPESDEGQDEDNNQKPDKTSDEDETNDDDSSNDTNNDDKKPDAGDGDDDKEDYKQKWKSLDGILKSQQQKHSEELTVLTSQIDALTGKLKEVLEGKKGDAAKHVDDDLTDDQKKALSEYEQEFDAVSKMEGLKRDKELARLRKEIAKDFEDKFSSLEEKVKTRMEPIEQTLQQDDEAKHFDRIKVAHGDYEQYRDNGDILKWIESKPAYLKESLKDIYNHGSADNVIGLISDFKIENKITENTETKVEQKKVDPVKEAKKQALTTVPAKKSAINTKKIDPNDFESAFDEAIKKLKS